MTLEQSGYAAVGGAVAGFLGMIASVFGLANLWLFMAMTGAFSLWALWVANRSPSNLSQYPRRPSAWPWPEGEAIAEANKREASKRSSANTPGREDVPPPSEFFLASPDFDPMQWAREAMGLPKSRPPSTPGSGPHSGPTGSSPRGT